MAASRYAAARSTRVCHSSGLMSARGRARSTAPGFRCLARSASFSAMTLSLSVAGSDPFCAPGPRLRSIVPCPASLLSEMIFAQGLAHFKCAKVSWEAKEFGRSGPFIEFGRGSSGADGPTPAPSAGLDARRPRHGGPDLGRRDIPITRMLGLACQGRTAPCTAETLQLPLCARVLEEARHAGGHGRLKHLDGRSPLAPDQIELAGIEIGLTMPLTLHGRIGVLGGGDQGLRSDQPEKERDHRAGPSREVQLCGIARQTLAIDVAGAGLGQVQAKHAIRSRGVELDGPG